MLTPLVQVKKILFLKNPTTISEGFTAEKFNPLSDFLEKRMGDKFIWSKFFY